MGWSGLLLKNSPFSFLHSKPSRDKQGPPLSSLRGLFADANPFREDVHEKVISVSTSMENSDLKATIVDEVFSRNIS